MRDAKPHSQFVAHYAGRITCHSQGVSRYYVRIGWGRGSWKSGPSKGCGVNFKLLQISSKSRQGGRGSKNLKILRMSLMDAPLAETWCFLGRARTMEHIGEVRNFPPTTAPPLVHPVTLISGKPSVSTRVKTWPRAMS